MTDKKIESLAIIGSGTMGSRISFQSALYGKQIHLYDIDPQALERSLQRISGWLEKKVSKVEAQKAMACIQPYTNLPKALTGIDLLIENVPENLDIKRKVFAELDQLAEPGIIFATNSSSLPSSRIASATNRPEYILNINFNDPPEGDYLVEMMYHEKTLPEAVKAVENYLLDIHCVPVITKKEIMGFSFNRIWRAIKRENLHLVGDGYSNFEELDRAWILSYQTPLGPFGMMDSIGLNVIRDIELVYYKESGEERDRPPAFLDEMVSAGYLGVKSGKGFYTYPDPEYLQPGWLTKEAPWTPEKAIQLPFLKP